MGRKRHSPEEIIAKLREIEVRLSRGERSAARGRAPPTAHHQGRSTPSRPMPA